MKQPLAAQEAEKRVVAAEPEPECKWAPQQGLRVPNSPIKAPDRVLVLPRLSISMGKWAKHALGSSKIRILRKLACCIEGWGL